MANLMPDAKRQIPERMQNSLDRLFIDLVFEEEQQIDVRLGMNRLAAVATDSEQREACRLAS